MKKTANYFKVLNVLLLSVIFHSSCQKSQLDSDSSEFSVTSSSKSTNKTSSISTTGLLAYWPFDGNGNDLSGNSNNATLYNLSSTTDRFGNSTGAFYFNGTSGYATVIDNSALRLNNTSFTLNAWVKLDSYHSSYGANILSKRIAGANNGYTWSVSGNLASPIGVVTYGPGGGSTNAWGSTVVGLSNWHMITSVYNYSAGTLSIYVDGTLDNTTSGIATSNGAITAALHIGRDAATNNYYVKGAMDDIRIYNRVLSSTEIVQLFNTIY